MFNNDQEELIFYRSLFNQMNASIYVLNLEPYAIEWVTDNQVIKDILGLNAQEVIAQGKFIAGRLLQIPDFQESVVIALKKFKENPDIKWAGVYRISGKNNGPNWVLYSTATLIKDENGLPTKAVCVAINLENIFNTPDTLQDFQKHLSREIYKDKDQMLTNRQREILLLTADGKTVKDISESLNLSKYTILDHKKAMFKKFECKSVKELLILAEKYGII